MRVAFNYPATSSASHQCAPYARILTAAPKKNHQQSPPAPERMFVRTTCTGIRAEGAHSTPISTLTAAPNSHHRHPDQHLQPHLARFRRTHPASSEARPPATKAMCGNRDAPQLGANNSNFGVAPIFHLAFRAHRSNRSDPKAIGRTRATPRAVLGGTLTSRRVGAATRRSASTTKAKRDPAVGGGE